MQFGKLSLKRCRYGWMLYSGPIIGKCFELYGQYSEAEVALMRVFLQPGDTAIDVGANIGDLTLPMAQLVGPNGRLYAIEANPANFNVLCANLALNEVGNTKAINAFVAEQAAQTAEMAAVTGTTWSVPAITLDALELESCKLIKVDVDGGELEVLQGAAMQIERFRPILYFENDRREKSADLLAFAKQTLGYDLYFHAAPVFAQDNFFGNTVNHWPQNVLSLMIVGLPSERGLNINLEPVRNVEDWWDPSIGT